MRTQQQTYQDASGLSILPRRFCPNSPGIVVGTGTAVVIRLSCRRWSCSVCHKALAAAFCRRANQLQYDWFLTIHAGWDVSRETCMRQSRCGRRYLELLRREVPGIGPLNDYAYGNESSPKTKRLHRHMLFRSPLRRLPFKTMVTLARRAGFRSKYPIRLERAAAGVNYSVKYGVKGMFDWPKYARRCFTTAKKAVKLKFEKRAFFPNHKIDPSVLADVVYEGTGEVVKSYVGPIYPDIVIDSIEAWNLRNPIGARHLEEERQSALPHSGGYRPPATEWDRVVADTDSQEAREIVHPNRPCGLHSPVIHSSCGLDPGRAFKAAQLSLPLKRNTAIRPIRSAPEPRRKTR